MLEFLSAIGYAYMLVVLVKYTYMTWVLGIPKDEVLEALNEVM